MNKEFEYLSYEQGSEAWLQMRMEHVTASNVAAIMGKCPYKTALQYGTELLTKVSTAKESYVFRKGHEAEAKAREWTQNHFKMELPSAVVRSLKYPYLVASLDGIYEEKEIIFEAKLVSREALAAVKQYAPIADHHRIQIQTQLLITGYSEAIYFVVDPDGNSALLTLVSDTAFQAEILAHTRSFWEKLKQGELPSPSDRDVRQVKDTRFEELAQLDRVIKDLTTRYDNLKKTLIKDYPDPTPISSPELSMIRYWQKGNIDWPELVAAHHIDTETLEMYRKEGSLRTKFTFKKE